MSEQIWGSGGVFLGHLDRDPFLKNISKTECAQRVCMCVLCYSKGLLCFLVSPPLACDLWQRPKCERCFPWLWMTADWPGRASERRRLMKGPVRWEGGHGVLPVMRSEGIVTTEHIRSRATLRRVQLYEAFDATHATLLLWCETKRRPKWDKGRDCDNGRGGRQTMRRWKEGTAERRARKTNRVRLCTALLSELQ